MKTITVTDFRRKASGFITEVEAGETLVLVRHGKPVAEIVPFTEGNRRSLAWRQPGIRLCIKGSELSTAILKEREACT